MGHVIRRFFVPIGVGRPGGRLRPLDGVPRDLEGMTRIFEARGYQAVPVGPDLDAAGLRAALGRWLDEAAPGPADAAVLYFSGHGCVVDGDHYLCPQGFSADQAAATGLKTQDLVELVVRRRPPPGKLWVIIDCCAAGGVLTNEILSRGLVASGAEVFVLAASGAWSPTFDGSFSAAFGSALAVAGAVPSLDRLVAAINARRPEARAVAAGFSWSGFDLFDERHAA